MNQIKLVSLVLVCFLVFISFPIVQNVNANTTIYIRQDGTVEGTNKIQRDGNVYTLVEDLSGSIDALDAFITIEKDNITIDGAGHSINGENMGLLQSLQGIGICIENRNAVTVQNVCVQNFLYGIYINSSSDTRINNCTLTKNNKGICVEFSSHSKIQENQITKNYDGFYVFKSCDTHVGRTVIDNNVNYGVFFALSWGELIDVIGYSVISNNGIGVRIVNSSVNHIIDQNSITENAVGIYLETSLIAVEFNNISYNDVGIQVNGSDNSITHNNFIENTKQVFDVAWYVPETSSSINRWYSGDTGNYWSDYTGAGENSYVIDENNQDNFPAIKPFQVPTQPWDPGLDYILPAMEGAAVLLIFMVAIVVVVFIWVKKRRKQKFEG